MDGRNLNRMSGSGVWEMDFEVAPEQVEKPQHQRNNHVRQIGF
jgi:hypothetical protein